MSWISTSAMAFDNVVRIVLRSCVLASASVLVLVMAATVSDNVGRWVLMPIQGVHELNALLIGMVIFLGAPYAQRRKSHITVTMLTGHLSRQVVAFINVLLMILAMLIFGWMSWLFFQSAVKSLVTWELVQGVSRFPLFPLRAVMLVGAVLLALQCFLDAIRNLLDLIHPFAADKSVMPQRGEQT